MMKTILQTIIFILCIIYIENNKDFIKQNIIKKLLPNITEDATNIIYYNSIILIFLLYLYIIIINNINKLCVFVNIIEPIKPKI